MLKNFIRDRIWFGWVYLHTGWTRPGIISAGDKDLPRYWIIKSPFGGNKYD